MAWFTNKGQILQWGTTVIFGSFAVAIGLFGSAAVLAALIGMGQMVLGLPLDWWILLSILVGGFVLMRWSQKLVNKGTSSIQVGSSPSQLQANEIIYPSPSKNGVLWRWVDGAGLSGPYCPMHRIRLHYWPNWGASRADFKEDDWLSANASFVCPLNDEEEFIFIRPSSLKVGQLRAHAAERFQSEVERAKVEDARVQADPSRK